MGNARESMQTGISALKKLLEDVADDEKYIPKAGPPDTDCSYIKSIWQEVQYEKTAVWSIRPAFPHIVI